MEPLDIKVIRRGKTFCEFEYNGHFYRMNRYGVAGRRNSDGKLDAYDNGLSMTLQNAIAYQLGNHVGFSKGDFVFDFQEHDIQNQGFQNHGCFVRKTSMVIDTCKREGIEFVDVKLTSK